MGFSRRLILIVIAGLFLLGFVVYHIWFHNPYEDKLRFDPQKVFAEADSSHRLLIRNATLIDIKEGKPVPNGWRTIFYAQAFPNAQSEALSILFSGGDSEAPLVNMMYQSGWRPACRILPGYTGKVFR